MDSWERANRLLTAIRHEIDLRSFDPKNYVAQELKPFFIPNYIHEWVKRREQDCNRRLISRAYLKELKRYVRVYFLPFFGKFSIKDLRKSHLDDFVRWLPENLSAKTMRNIIGVLRKLFQDAYDREDIAAMPLFPKIAKGESVTRWLNEEEQAHILAHTRGVYRAFFTFLMHTGCRGGEARALKWEYVDLKNDVVTICAGFDLGQFKPYTKEREVRYLPLHPEARTALLSLPRSLAGWVFVNSRGRPLSQRAVCTAWQKAREKAGINVTCYEGTRHSFASQAINRGISERKIGDFLGHKHSSSTRRYAKMRAEALREVLAECPQTVPGDIGAINNMPK